MSIHIHQYIVRFDVPEKNRRIQFLVGKNKHNQLLGKITILSENLNFF